MPVTETIELLERLHADAGAHAHTVIANRVLPVLFDRREQPFADRLDEALPVLIDAAGEGVRTVLEAARLTEARRQTGAGHLDRIQAALDRDEALADVATITVPELFARAPGPRVVTLIADTLADELDTS